jgi:hypothetical protein
MIMAAIRVRVVICCVLCLMAACAKSTAPGSTAGRAGGAGTPSSTATSVCSRLILKAGDFSGILTTPIIRSQPFPGDAQSCEFITASYPEIIVSVRPAVGRTTVDDWATGKMPLESRPLTGIGDSAVWLETLLELVAQKNAVLCDIQVRGGGSDLAVESKALPAALGVLCNKLFAAT